MPRHLVMPGRRLIQMLALPLAVAAACVLGASAQSAPKKEAPGTWCGGTRWRLMTLSDPQRYKVTLRGAPSSIADIAELRAPARTPETRATAFQRQVWRMRTVIDLYRIASNG